MAVTHFTTAFELLNMVGLRHIGLYIPSRASHVSSISTTYVLPICSTALLVEGSYCLPVCRAEHMGENVPLFEGNKIRYRLGR